MLSNLALAIVATQTAAAELSEGAAAIRGYYECVRSTAKELEVSGEPAGDVAIAARVRCTPARVAALPPADRGRENATMERLATEMAIAAVVEARATRKAKGR
jgi:hypothetical protein